MTGAGAFVFLEAVAEALGIETVGSKSSLSKIVVEEKHVVGESTAARTASAITMIFPKTSKSVVKVKQVWVESW